MENQEMENQEEQEILSVGIKGGRKGCNIFFALFFIAVAALTVWTGFELQNKGEAGFIYFFIAVALSVFAATAIVFFRSEKMPVHRQFALLFAVLGFFYFVLVPFLGKFDEREHFLRTFEITRGHFISDQIPGTRNGGQRLPDNIPPKNLDDYPYTNATLLSCKTVLENIDERLNENELVWRNLANSSIYPPFAYVLHLPGIIIAEKTTDKSLYLGYAARLSAFLLVWLFLFLIIKKTPYKQKTILALSLAPVFLYQSTAISADTLINLVTLLSIGTALIFAASQDEYKLSYKVLLIIALLSFFATLGKVVYFPIALIFLLIPSSKFENPKHWKIFFIVLFGICILSNAGWLLLWKLHIGTYKTATVAVGGDISSGIAALANSNTGLQIQAALKNPGELLKFIWEAFVYDNRNAIFKAFIPDFGNGLDPLSINRIIAIVYLLSAVSISFSDSFGKAISYKRLFFVFFISSFLIVMAVFAPLVKNHLTMTGFTLEQLQVAAKAERFPAASRYLFPAATILLMCLNSKRIRFNSELILQYCLPIICFVNLFVLSKIVLHFAR